MSEKNLSLPAPYEHHFPTVGGVCACVHVCLLHIFFNIVLGPVPTNLCHSHTTTNWTFRGFACSAHAGDHASSNFAGVLGSCYTFTPLH